VNNELPVYDGYSNTIQKPQDLAALDVSGSPCHHVTPYYFPEGIPLGPITSIIAGTWEREKNTRSTSDLESNTQSKNIQENEISMSNHRSINYVFLQF
jgi:hypothetical protein